MTPVTFSTGSLYTYGVARVFELAARAGYDGLELMLDERWDTRHAHYVHGLMERYDLPVLSVHSPFVPGIAGWPGDEVARIEKALVLAQVLGSRVLNVHLPMRLRDLIVTTPGGQRRIPIPRPTTDQRNYRQWLVDGRLAALQATTDIDVVIENLPMRRFLGQRFSPAAMNTWGELRAFPKICLDTTHCGTTGSDLLAVQAHLADRIAHVHLSDYADGRQHLTMGRGSLPLDAFLQALAARTFSGMVVVELQPSALPVHDEEQLATELHRNLEFCRLHLGETPIL